jgi:Flp pilus assembly protein TadD
MTPEALFAEAAQALRGGRLAEAAAACREILLAAPDHVESLLLLGALESEAGRFAAARDLIAKAVDLRPDFAPGQFALGNALRGLGRHGPAAAAYRKAAALAPGLAAAHYNLANTLRDLGDLEAAAAAYRAAIAAAADHAETHTNLGAVLQDLGRPDEALEAYRRAAALAARDPTAHFNLGRALRRAGQPEAAAAAYRTALALKPDYAEAWINLGNVLFDLNRNETAAEAYGQAATLRPGDAEARLNLAEAQQALGQTAAALAGVHEALALDPASARGWLILSNLKTFAPDDPDIGRMEALLAAQGSGRQSREARIDLGFALGKAWTDAGEADLAFANLSSANRLKRADLAYDVQADVDWLERIAAASPPALFERFAGAGAASELPVFILGMPRSGTSLVEQILASHPEVHGAGELNDLEAVIRQEAGVDDVAQAYPAMLSGLSATALKGLGEAYLARIRPLAGDAARITDKMPGNFPFAGLIALMLPQARIIHCRRNPMDTCLSCYSKKFTSGQAFTYDLRDLGCYYRAYAALMAHWRRVLPPERFIEVDYEQVVGDLEGEARRLVAFCGLAWDEACHETRRAVRTASVNQVRQPLYAGSVERWRAFERHLGPLLAALGEGGTPGLSLR